MIKLPKFLGGNVPLNVLAKNVDEYIRSRS